MDVADGFSINLPEVEKIARTVLDGGGRLKQPLANFAPMHNSMGAVPHSPFLAELSSFTDGCHDALNDLIGQVHTFGDNVIKSAKEYAAADLKAHDGIYLAGGN